MDSGKDRLQGDDGGNRHWLGGQDLARRTRSRGLADSAQDGILREVLAAQRSATEHVDTLWGAIDEHASRAPGSGRQQRDQDSAAAREGIAEGEEANNVTGRDVDAVEREGLQSLDAAERAEQLLAGLQVAMQRLRAAPARFQRDGQLLLIKTELMFGQHGTALEMTGQLRVGPDGSRSLTISRVGSGERIFTPMTFTQLQQLGIPVHLDLQLTRLGLRPGIFSGPSLDEAPSGNRSALEMDEAGTFQWGLTDEALGLHVTQSSVGWVDVPPTEADVESRRPGAAEAGRLAKLQIEQVLRNTPVQEIRNTAL